MTTGTALAVLGWLVVLGPLAGTAHAQLSPGPLSEAHSDLDSLFECTSCHALGVGRAEFRCTSCHTEIADRIQAGTGYHARVAPSETGNEACVDCHAEHFGRDFEILKWPSGRDRFDHDETGYRLQGRHAQLGCDDCHKPAHIAPEQQSGILMDLDRSMLGLSETCTSCHEDVHRNRLGQDCASCHTFEGWSPAPGFRHQETRFPLTGLHAGVACNGCHHEGDATQFGGLAFQTCEDCHADPHRAAFAPAQCRSCHDTSGWKNVGSALPFDHSKTSFALEGAHADQSCSSCHNSTGFSEPIPHDRCLDCHKDEHSGQFLSRPDGGDCASCHDVESFRTTSFTAEDHSETAYPLIGMHQAVQCDGCHAAGHEGGTDTNYHPASDACLDCHSDTHDGQFEHLSDGACESCHTVDGFRPSTFTLTDHDASRFPLTGAHRAVVCFGCHEPLSGEPDSPLQFRMEDRSCTSCHEDPHKPTGSPGTLAEAAPDCETCHTTGSWDMLSGFDHATTRFPLLGAHRVASCASCHEDAGPSGAAPRFDAAPLICEGCHEDVHRGQFRGVSGTTECDSCHQPASWTRIRFDHERDSDFHLEGAHEAVACVMCHLERTAPDGTLVRVFEGTPTECAECH